MTFANALITSSVKAEAEAIFLQMVVEIPKTKSVNALKEAIKDEKPHTFQDIETDSLILWKVRGVAIDTIEPTAVPKTLSSPILH
jgi:Crinkler effector protein N-terminal domain